MIWLIAIAISKLPLCCWMPVYALFSFKNCPSGPPSALFRIPMLYSALRTASPLLLNSAFKKLSLCLWKTVNAWFRNCPTAFSSPPMLDSFIFWDHMPLDFWCLMFDMTCSSHIICPMGCLIPLATSPLGHLARRPNEILAHLYIHPPGSWPLSQ